MILFEQKYLVIPETYCFTESWNHFDDFKEKLVKSAQQLGVFRKWWRCVCWLWETQQNTLLCREDIFLCEAEAFEEDEELNDSGDHPCPFSKLCGPAGHDFSPKWK